MEKIIFIRHPETIWNVKKIEQGHKDTDLSEKGKIQSAFIINQLKKIGGIKCIYCSDLSRTLSLATSISDDLNIPLKSTELLREQNIGQWEGLTKKQVNEINTKFYYNNPIGMNTLPPLGESRLNFTKRVVDEFLKITSSSNNDVKVLLIHGGTIKCILSFIIGLNSWVPDLFRIDNASFSQIERMNKNFAWTVSFINRLILF